MTLDSLKINNNSSLQDNICEKEWVCLVDGSEGEYKIDENNILRIKIYKCQDNKYIFGTDSDIIDKKQSGVVRWVKLKDYTGELVLRNKKKYVKLEFNNGKLLQKEYREKDYRNIT